MLAALRSVLKNAASEAVTESSDVAESTVLDGLRSLLRDDDPEAGEFLKRHRALLQRCYSSRYPALERAIETFDFTAALDLMSTADSTRGKG